MDSEHYNSSNINNLSPYKATDDFDNDDDDMDRQQQIDSYEVNAPALRSQSSQFSEPPMLMQTYSGISNASSTPDFTIHSSRVSEEPFYGFNFIKAQKLYTTIEKLVKQVAQALSLEDDIAMYVLYRHQWSKQRLYQKYSQIAQQCHLTNSTLKQSLAHLKINPTITTHTGICEVCQSQQTLKSNLLCNHSYCRKCWLQYLKTQLQQNNHIFFACMNKCQHSITMPHTFVQCQFPQFFQLYRKLICINFTTNNKSISYCPNTGLRKSITNNNNNNSKKQCQLFCERAQCFYDICVQCQCGDFYCFYCRKQPHYPATCDDVTKWNKLLNDQESNTQWIQKNTKACPKCKKNVEKIIGCSHIKCICGAQFCYQCNAKWDQNHKSFKGQCGSLVRKSSLQQRTSTSGFLALHQKCLALTRTQKKHLQTLTTILQSIKQQWILSKFQGIRKQVTEAWLTLKWCNIVSFIYKRPQVQQFQDQFIDSIVRLMDSVQKLQSFCLIVCPKDILAVGDQVINRREAVRKNKEVWMEVWRNSN